MTPKERRDNSQPFPAVTYVSQNPFFLTKKIYRVGNTILKYTSFFPSLNGSNCKGEIRSCHEKLWKCSLGDGAVASKWKKTATEMEYKI